MKVFKIDQQTKDDLDIFESTTNIKSIFSLFDFTSTIGGRDLLKKIFKNPINELKELENRNYIIKVFSDNDINFKFKREVLDYVEFYLGHNDKPASYSNIKAFENSFKYFFWPDQQYYLKERGVYELLDLLKFFKNYFFDSKTKNALNIFEDLQLLVSTVNANSTINKCMNRRPRALRKIEIEKCDFLLRSIYIQNIKEIINIIYKLDVYSTVAEVSKKHQLAFPVFNSSSKVQVNLEGVFHLFLNNPIPNNVRIDSEQNIFFITGVNMSGKSTVIKSVAIAVYLAHLGFPVPATKMETSVFNGVITTINLSDNLNKGRSHFYNEVLRLKYVAEMISSTDRVLIIFDELFRGTNIKDAFESSLSIVSLFAQITDNLFIISTHIVEVAKQLSKNKKIKFCYLQTLIENERPKFDYKLQKGITGDRIGLWIIKNEGIIEILEEKISNLIKDKIE